MPDVEPVVTVTIASRNGARMVDQTVRSVVESAERSGRSWELLLVDNASTDQTPAIFRSLATSPAIQVIDVPVPGLSRARNAAVDAARGRVLLFTDDDVVVPPTWVSDLSEPVLSSGYHAVAGPVQVAGDDDQQAWTELHRALLADTGAGLGNPPRTLVGASMAIATSAFRCGFRFEESLGAGALGCMEESLLYWQLRQAGASACFVEGSPVQHHVDLARLRRAEWLARARAQGRCEAWVHYHWLHGRLSPRDAKKGLRGEVRRARCWTGRSATPGELELSAVRDIAACSQMMRSVGSHRRFQRPRWTPVDAVPPP